MNSIVYVGMDVHKEQYTLCCYSYDTDRLNINRQYHQIINLFLNIWNRFVQDMKVRFHLSVDMRQDVWVILCIIN